MVPRILSAIAQIKADVSAHLHADATERLHDRTELLAGFDRLRRDLDASGSMEAMDRFTQQATTILT